MDSIGSAGKQYTTQPATQLNHTHGIKGSFEIHAIFWFHLFIHLSCMWCTDFPVVGTKQQRFSWKCCTKVWHHLWIMFSHCLVILNAWYNQNAHLFGQSYDNKNGSLEFDLRADYLFISRGFLDDLNLSFLHLYLSQLTPKQHFYSFSVFFLSYSHDAQELVAYWIE